MTLTELSILTATASENMNALNNGSGDLELLEKQIAQLVRCVDDLMTGNEHHPDIVAAEATIKTAINTFKIEF